MSLSDRLVRLRVVVFRRLGAVEALGFCLAQINGIRLNTPIVRTTVYCFLGHAIAVNRAWLTKTYALGASASERTPRWFEFAADFLALMLIRHLFPLAMTVASYWLVPHSIALADKWLS